MSDAVTEELPVNETAEIHTVNPGDVAKGLGLLVLDGVKWGWSHIPARAWVASVGILGLLGGTAIGSSAGYSIGSASLGEHTEPAIIVTATPEPEVVVDTTSQDMVRLPGACTKAIETASKISDDVSPVVAVYGEQRDLMSKARLAINGSDYISMGEVMRDQTELEDGFAGNFTRLATAYHTLDTALEECQDLLGR